jgi:hypothetical protein
MEETWASGSLELLRHADPKDAEATLENVILLYNKEETLVRKAIEDSVVDIGHTFKLEMAMRDDVLKMEDIKQISELRMIRNAQVHSTAENIDKKRIGLGVDIAETLIKKAELPEKRCNSKPVNAA